MTDEAKLILSELKGMRSDIAELKSDVAELKEDSVQLHEEMRNIQIAMIAEGRFDLGRRLDDAIKSVNLRLSWLENEVRHLKERQEAVTA